MSDLPKIILHNDVTAHFAEKLKAWSAKVTYKECNSYEDLPALVDSWQPDIVYTVRFNGTPGYPREALFGRNGPKWIANGGAGTDHFGDWDPERVTVTNTAGVAADMMAEYVMGGYLHFTLNVSKLLQDKVSRVWNPLQMTPLKGKTLLIVGLGHTGRALAVRAKAFGMHVIGTRARPQAMDCIDEVHPADDLLQLLPRADFIAVCTPLTGRTRGLLNASALSTVRPGVILADVSRGGVVVQSALLEALEDGRIAAAILDVFETEPLPQANPLWLQDRVLISPHCSSVFEGWEMASFEMFLTNLDRWISSEPLENVVEPSRGY